MKLKELMRNYDYTSPIRVFENGEIIYDESDKYFCGSKVYDCDELEELEWYQRTEGFNVISFGPTTSSDTGEAVQCITIAEAEA